MWEMDGKYRSGGNGRLRVTAAWSTAADGAERASISTELTKFRPWPAPVPEASNRGPRHPPGYKRASAGNTSFSKNRRRREKTPRQNLSSEGLAVVSALRASFRIGHPELSPTRTPPSPTLWGPTNSPGGSRSRLPTSEEAASHCEGPRVTCELGR